VEVKDFGPSIPVPGKAVPGNGNERMHLPVTAEIACTPSGEHGRIINVSHAPYGPLTVAFCLPVGALLYLNHRWKMRVAGQSLAGVALSMRRPVPEMWS
jgi:hypothetical protein